MTLISAVENFMMVKKINSISTSPSVPCGIVHFYFKIAFIISHNITWTRNFLLIRRYFLHWKKSLIHWCALLKGISALISWWLVTWSIWIIGAVPLIFTKLEVTWGGWSSGRDGCVDFSRKYTTELSSIPLRLTCNESLIVI